MINQIRVEIDYANDFVTEIFSNPRDAIDFLQAEWDKAEEEDSKV